MTTYGSGSFGHNPYGGYAEVSLLSENGIDGKWYGEQWETCDVCGWWYPISRLRLQTLDGGGRKVCIAFCYDEPGYGDYRAETELPTEGPLGYVDEGGSDY